MPRPVVRLVLCPFSGQYLGLLGGERVGLGLRRTASTHKSMMLGISLPSVGPHFPFITWQYGSLLAQPTSASIGRLPKVTDIRMLCELWVWVKGRRAVGFQGMSPDLLSSPVMTTNTTMSHRPSAAAELFELYVPWLNNPRHLQVFSCPH